MGSGNIKTLKLESISQIDHTFGWTVVVIVAAMFVVELLVVAPGLVEFVIVATVDSAYLDPAFVVAPAAVDLLMSVDLAFVYFVGFATAGIVN